MAQLVIKFEGVRRPNNSW